MNFCRVWLPCGVDNYRGVRTIVGGCKAVGNGTRPASIRRQAISVHPSTSAFMNKIGEHLWVSTIACCKSEDSTTSGNTSATEFSILQLANRTVACKFAQSLHPPSIFFFGIWRTDAQTPRIRVQIFPSQIYALRPQDERLYGVSNRRQKAQGHYKRCA